MTLLHESDKSFWHGFVDFYEPFFANIRINTIAEIGIFKGNSVKWLLTRFPDAIIYGADILPIQPEWPIDDRFNFSQLDQGNRELIQIFFGQNSYDLIIEDGSHLPEHQALALIEGLKRLNSGGIYILEDIHTSHRRYNSKSIGAFEYCPGQNGNALTVLLALMHYQELGIKIDETKVRLISENSLFSIDEVTYLSKNAKHIHFYRRSKLPQKCYACGSSDYHFSILKCSCGVDVFSDADSMTFVIEKQ
jgi:hypothetical protein